MFQFKAKGECVPFMYVLSEVHKLNISLRPVISILNSPYHKLARWLAKLLERICRKMANHTL